MKTCFLFVFLLFPFMVGLSQTANTQKPCSSLGASQFDFWIGDWELTWNDTSHGTNRISKIMDGCTISENFHDPASDFSGGSWSVFNPQSGKWYQTWVDNQGGYIALTGTFENDMMTLATEPRKMPDGKPMISRMVFYNITPGKFDWRWESTKDDGNTWQTNWLIHYKRK